MPALPVADQRLTARQLRNGRAILDTVTYAAVALGVLTLERVVVHGDFDPANSHRHSAPSPTLVNDALVLDLRRVLTTNAALPELDSRGHFNAMTIVPRMSEINRAAPLSQLVSAHNTLHDAVWGLSATLASPFNWTEEFTHSMSELARTARSAREALTALGYHDAAQVMNQLDFYLTYPHVLRGDERGASLQHPNLQHVKRMVGLAEQHLRPIIMFEGRPGVSETRVVK